MRIADVRITSADPDGAARFYATVLGLPVSVTAGEGSPAVVQVGVGASTLSLVPGPTGPGVHHIAFDVPSNRFADARRWLARRVPLIARDGVEEFAGPGTWNSQSVYFLGPDGAVLELIARHALANGTDRPFGSADLLNVSEIGIAVPDVPIAGDQLCRTFDVRPFGSGSGTFAPVGDHDGLLILVAAGRVWFPTRGSVSQGGPTTVTLAGTSPGTWVGFAGDCTVSCG